MRATTHMRWLLVAALVGCGPAAKKPAPKIVPPAPPPVVTPTPVPPAPEPRDRD